MSQRHRARAACLATAQAGSHGRRERRDGQGRDVLPDHGQEAPPRAGGCGAEPPALRVPWCVGDSDRVSCRMRTFRRLACSGQRRGVLASPGRGLPRQRPLRAHLLQPGEPSWPPLPPPPSSTHQLPMLCCSHFSTPPSLPCLPGEQANMSAQGIPQISVVMGSCTVGGSAG